MRSNVLYLIREGFSSAMFQHALSTVTLYCLCLWSVVYGHECPKKWIPYNEHCYKFVRYPTLDYQSARLQCDFYNAQLVSISSSEEFRFIEEWLTENDPFYRRWYTSGILRVNSWNWEGEDNSYINFDFFLDPPYDPGQRRNAAYTYSSSAKKSGLIPVFSDEQLPFICEIHQKNSHEIPLERYIGYGVNVLNEEKVPRGPRFIKTPESAVVSRHSTKVVVFECAADGYPLPNYVWYKAEYRRDEIVNKTVDPLSDYRYTQTDGTLQILDPSPNIDRGQYFCIASNQYGLVKSPIVKLTFGNNVEFPKSRQMEYGKENWGKALSCNAPRFYPSVFYAWNRDKFASFVQEDRRVFSSFDGTLYFSSVEKADQGNYSCMVKNPITDDGRIGPKFYLEVQPATSKQKLQFPNNFLKIFPDNPTVGNDVRLECMAYGYPTPFYKWTREGRRNELPKNSNLKSYNRVLIISNVKEEDQGKYVCKAYNEEESIETSIKLSLEAFPKFTIPLEDAILDSGSQLKWKCEAYGIPEVEYSWYKNGNRLKSNMSSFGYGNRYRIQDNVLIIDEVSEEDKGTYQCRAKNELGVVISSGRLKILSLAPNFIKYPLEPDVYVAEGGNLTIPCRPEAVPPPKYSWSHNGKAVSGGRFRIKDNGYLHIESARFLDEGIYTCEATNRYGSAKSSGRLVVLPYPSLREFPPRTMTAKINTNLTLKCEARVSPLLEVAYIWYLNGLRIDFTMQKEYSVGDNAGYLDINNISLAQAGVYTCLAKTYLGSVNASTELVVLAPPAAPAAVLADDLSITSGFIHWSDGTDNGRPIHHYVVEGYTEHNKTWSFLINASISKTNVDQYNGRRRLFLENVLSPWNVYSFRVSAINEIGRGPPSLASPTYPTGNDKPYKTPSNVGGGGGHVGTLTITWSPLPMVDWNAPNIWYNVYYRKLGSKEEYYRIDLKDVRTNGWYTVNVGEENYYLKYQVRVQAINDLGPGPISDAVTVYSAGRMPQVRPINVKALPFNSTSLNVSWDPIDMTREKVGGKLIGYRIKYWIKDKNPETDSLILLNWGTTPWGLIVGLRPFTEYWVSVMAYNDAGSGVESEKFLARTYKMAPQRAPTNVNVKFVSFTSASVRWRGMLTSTEEEPIMGYKVRYWVSGQDLANATDVIKCLDGEDLEVKISGLKFGITYTLRVLAYSLGGDGKMSSPPSRFTIVYPQKGGEESRKFQFPILLIILIIHFVNNP
ncbi:contactin-like isoform X1 [Centruroides sculpturatus]|uniref:contactin-like isoform X1 n=2 Tax=Centruroides sculpturatus TaxID=218467 RepID=UPI000C6D2EEF|nr:contactin-like isoform X1 [Centruroides sculpturatus]